LGFGANPNLRETARHDSAVICIAYAKGYWEIVESLIKWGADTENIMDRETTPFP
jgi:hypothetical protein